ncbi:hypothetical protein D7B24_009498 [Verticillium nonalfalfae]|uniref:Major facilitator superfamily (MFS) profile domain-containing protein n=1 Tax=Verticillium nonalfalfae TaxID=1051616 RepID=A0A3M9Y3H5_9PEZI|nr:uncharacterized protein D7B24_009498 [Verticillium nonalfalfae]RNJ54675.1 hypothetical protein D7B24_009498 [Verticillium nonalfalfae]
MTTDSEKKTREEIQDELHIEVVPGTEVMADVLKHELIKSEHSSVVLVPQPSQDPHDPLNWKASWKWSVSGAVSLMTFTQGFAPLSLASMFPYLIRDYESNLEDVIQFTGVTILILGFSNFLWAPIMSSFGRRPVFITSQLVCLASHVLRARATTYGSFMGACVLNGIGAGPSETLQPQVIADIYFLHDRGRWNTLYWVVYMGSLMIAPVIAGPMADHVGWQNFWWLNVAMTAASIVYAFFGFPETMWTRAQPAQDAVTIEVAEQTVTPAEPTVMDPFLGKGAPSKQQWKLFQPNSSPLKTIWFDLWTPWKLFGFPIVLFSSFVASWSCSSFLILNLTQSQVFAAPPYNMSSQSIGFLNLAVLVVIVVLGYTSAGIQVAALPSIASTYAIDCYKPVTGPLMVAITVNKNVWGYGMGKFITPWTIKSGFIPVFMTNMALTVFWCGLGVVFYFHGKTFRRWTRNSKVHDL